jgi:hypothetical protein
MTQFDATHDPIARWRSVVDALDRLVMSNEGEPNIAAEEVEDVRRLVAFRLAAARRNSLPAVWVRRGRGGVPIAPEPSEAADHAEQDEGGGPVPDPPSRLRPDWRE